MAQRNREIAERKRRESSELREKSLAPGRAGVWGQRPQEKEKKRRGGGERGRDFMYQTK